MNSNYNTTISSEQVKDAITLFKKRPVKYRGMVFNAEAIILLNNHKAFAHNVDALGLRRGDTIVCQLLLCANNLILLAYASGRIVDQLEKFIEGDKVQVGLKCIIGYKASMDNDIKSFNLITAYEILYVTKKVDDIPSEKSFVPKQSFNISEEDANLKLLRNFILRPQKYIDSIIHLDGVLDFHNKGARPKELSYLGLDLGDTVSSYLKIKDDNHHLKLYAQNKMADELESYKEGDRVAVKLRCLFALKEIVVFDNLLWYDEIIAFEVLTINSI